MVFNNSHTTTHLIGEKIILRNFKKTDIENFFKIHSDEMIVKYYGIPKFKNLNFAKLEIIRFNEEFKSKKAIRWVITTKNDDNYIGHIGLLNVSNRHKRAEIGIILNKKFWNKGFATYSNNLVINYAFTKTQLNRIEAHIDELNIGAIKALIKSGFKEDGCLREHEFENNKFINIKVLSFIKKDYETEKIKTI